MASLDAITAAAVVLAEAGIPAHVQELLTVGSAVAQIPHGVLGRAIDAARAADQPQTITPMPGAKFSLGTPVGKTSGAQWSGLVCGFYATALTPIGYCVESFAHKGSVQIYPEQALRPLATLLRDTEHG
jgi:hypothetical protein